MAGHCHSLFDVADCLPSPIDHPGPRLLAKGDVTPPPAPIPDVLDWTYTGNRLHPTQKPVKVLRPLIEAFGRPGNTVLDPFCGSGSTLVAAKELACRFVGIELDRTHYLTAARRLREQSAGLRAPSPAPCSSPSKAGRIPALFVEWRRSPSPLAPV